MKKQLQSMDRRCFIRVAAGSPFALGAATPATAMNSQIADLFEKRMYLEGWINKNTHRFTDDELDAYCDEVSDIDAQILSLPSTSAGDFAAKVIVDSSRGGCWADWETGPLWIEARALTGAPL